MDALPDNAALQARVRELESRLAEATARAVHDPVARAAESRERSAWLALALESAHMGVWSWRVSEDEVRWSDEVAGLFGMTPAAFGGTYSAFEERVHPEDRERVRDTVRDTLASGSSDYSVEHRIVRADGVVRWLEGHGRVFRDGQGQPMQLIGTVRDVTERKEAAEALRESKEQLRHAQRLESVGRLAGGVAHDFNNLLTVIMGCVDLFQLEGEENLELAQAIRDATHRGATLTQQLLTFARKQVVRPRRFDVNERVAASASMLRILLGADVELSTRLSVEAVGVEADPGQLEQVLVNLAVNARDAMPRGGVLAIETSRVDRAESRFDGEVLPAGPWARITVRDSGTGIPADVLPFVFEPFYTTKPPGKGTGLGLSTCFGIVRQAGGLLELESETGKGTTVHVLLPCVDGPVPAVDFEPGLSPAGNRELVLLVEDDPLVLRVNRVLLKQLGYELLEASSAERALEVFAEHGPRIDLVISDRVMPGMGGAALARDLLTQRSELAILLVSGYAMEDGPAEDWGGACVASLQKPFSKTALASAIRRLLGAPRDSS